MAQIIYGIHPVKEALNSSHLHFEKIYIGTPKPHAPIQSILDLANKRHIPVVFTTKEVLEQMAHGGVHQSVVGILKEFPYADIEKILSDWKKEGAESPSLYSRRHRGSTKSWLPDSHRVGLWSSWNHHPKTQGNGDHPSSG